MDRTFPHASNSLRRRLLTLGLAFLLAAGQLAVQGPKAVHAATGPIQYVYDSDGRLIGVVDPAAQAAKIGYDADGNVTSISTYNSSTVSIIGTTPSAGAVGAAVKIYGSDYSSTPSQNTVTFNGVATSVSASTFTELDVLVPVGATTGTVKVTAPGGSATSTFSFTVLGLASPSVSSVSTSVVDAGATFTVSGTNFQTVATNNEVVLGHYQATVSSATSSSISLTAPPVGAGPITVVTPYGKAVSTGDVFVPPAPYTAAQVSATGRAQFGQTTSLTISTPGTIGLLALDASAGQRASFLFDESGFNGCCNNFALYSFDGSLIFNGGAGFVDTYTFPITGTYMFGIAPGGSNTGTGKVTVYNVPPDVTTSMSLPAVGSSSQASVTVNTPGQDASITFNIASIPSGMRFAINGTPAGPNYNNMSVVDPNGTQLESGGMGWTDDITPTVVGTYTIKIDYLGSATGTASVTLYNVPVDASSSIAFPAVGSSTPASVTINTPGQDANFTFNIPSVTSGMRIAINGVPAGSNFNNMFVIDPNGTQLSGGGMGWTDDITPTVAGTYTINIDYLGMATGTASVTLYNVPLDASSGIAFPAVGSSTPASVTINTPGQDANFTFNIPSVTSGMRIAINGVPAGSNFNNMFVIDPNGTQLEGGGMGWTDVIAPTVAGTYTIKIDYLGMATGTASVTLYNVPLDATSSLSFPAPGSSTQTSVTTTTPGQNASVTFSASSGATVTFTFDETQISGCCNQFTVLNPDGTTLSSTGAGTVGPVTLAQTGTYTINVNYSGLNTGTATITLTAPASGGAVRRLSANPEDWQAGALIHSLGKGPSKTDPSTSQSKPQPAPPPAAAAAPNSQPDWTPRSLPGGNVDDQIYAPLPSSLPDLRAPQGVTALAGRSLRLNGEPLAGVTFSIGNQHAKTDGTGRFLLTHIASGRQVLRIDGSTADRAGAAYGVYEVAIQIDPGKSNPLGFINWMTRLDMAHAVTIPSPTTTDTVITTPYIPGLEIHLPAGTVMKDDSGRVVTQLSVTAIPVNRPPFPLPLGVQVPIYFTVQPGGTYISPKGARIIYPNYAHQIPGSRVEFWNYDPDVKGWYIYGHGTVTQDGKQVVPDPGVVVWQFSGAMINSGFLPWLLGELLGIWNWDGDPVDLSTGNFVLRKTDLALPGNLPIAFNRIYNASDTTSRSFGIGATNSYDINLYSTNQYQVASLYLPGFGPINYVRVSPGTGFADAVFQAQTTPSLFYQSKIAWNGNGWNLSLRDGTTYVFGENAPLQSISDAFGNRITLIRSQGKLGNITTILSTSGRWLKLAYDGSNRITQVQDNSGRRVQYSYDTSGRLQTVTDANGGVTTYGYDSNNRMTTITDPRTLVYLTNHYDSNGRVYQQDLVNTSQHYLFAYTTSNGKVTKTDVTDPRGNKREVTFNTDGFNVSDEADVGGASQELTQIGRQAGTDLVTSITDPLNRVTQFGYDASGNVNLVTQMSGAPDARSYQFTYEPTYNRLASVTDPRQKTSTFTYDDVNHTQTLTDPLGHQTVVSFNTNGQAVSVKDGLQHVWSYGYTFGDLTSMTDPLGNTSSTFYDGAGRVAATTDAVGRTSTATYDALNQMTSMTDPLGQMTVLVYDADGNLKSLKDSRGNLTSYTYDNFNRVTTRTDPDQRVQTYNTYDPNGNLTQLTDQKGQIICLKYDDLNRPTFVGFAANTTCPSASSYQSSITYGWDFGNRLHTLTDSAAGTITHDWDDFDRPKDDVTPQGTVSYTFDVADRLQTITVPGQTTYSYVFDDSNLLSSISQGATTLFSEAHDSAGRLISETLPDGIVGTYSYDNANRLAAITYTKGTTTLGNIAYIVDPVGRVSTLGGTWGRANIPASVTSATYDAANQVQTRAGKTFTYDANGNLTSDGTTSYSWNARNQLTSVGSGSSKLTFTYDALGHRVTLATTKTTTSYLYVGASPVQEIQAGKVTANQVPATSLDQEIGRTDSTGTSSYLTDGLGSTVALANSSGAVQTQYTYDPYGATTSSGTASSNSYDFTGRQSDSSGLYYYRARYYSPGQQRFISSDPLGFGGGDTNLYRYVSDSPTNLTDPSGEALLVDTAIGCAVGGAIGAFGTWAENSLAGRKTTVGDLVKSAAIGCVIGALFTLIGPAADYIFGAEAPEGAAVLDEGAPAIKAGSAGGDSAGMPFSQSVRQEVLDDNPSTCVYCRMETDSPQVDHAIPRAQGGNATVDNGQTTCPWCNASKGARDFPVNPPPGYQGEWPPAWWFGETG